MRTASGRQLFRVKKGLSGLGLFTEVPWKAGEGVFTIRPDGVMRFVNHACRPNCRVQDRLLVAERDIKAGEELTVDYAQAECQPLSPSEACRCGAHTEA